MKPLLLFACALRLLAQPAAPLTADAAGVFAIWPGVAPGSETWSWREKVTGSSPNRMVRNVTAPSLTMYRPKPGTSNGASVIIAPGGAFHFLMVDYEGVDMARWLAERGVTAF